MRRRFFVSIAYMRLLALLLLVCAPSEAAIAPTSPALRKFGKPVALVSKDNLTAAKMYGAAGQMRIVTATDQSFESAISAQTKIKTTFPYDVVIAIPVHRAVRKGDVLFGRFHARCIDQTRCIGRISYVFNLARPPYRPAIEFPVQFGSHWEEFQVPFIAGEDYGEDESRVRFQIGGEPQSIEIGGIETLDYAGSADIHDLPQPQITYEGRGPSAPWRKAAAERINQLRKAPLTIRVSGPAGKPLAGASIEVKMTRHAFPFGAAVSGESMLDPSPEGERYRQKVKELFNTVAIENDLKWPWWERSRERALRLVALLGENGISVRGHVLVWGTWSHFPGDVETLRDDPPALQKRIADHILDEAGALRGQVAEWDTVDEPFTNHALADVLGENSIPKWFGLAHQGDPGAKLILNDEGIDPASLTPEHQAYLNKTVKSLIEQHAPVNGIGLQGHFGWQLTPLDELNAVLDRLGKHRLGIEITEFDVTITDEKLQADYLRDFMTMAFSHPAVDGFILWVWDARSNSLAALFNEDWSPRPNGKQWLNLVFHQWWTKESGKSDEKGLLAVRGFMGNYQITVNHDGKSQTKMIDLEKGGKEVLFELP